LPTALVAHLLSPDPDAAAAALAGDVRFASPFADYADRERIAGLFAVMPRVFDELTAVRELRGPDGERATVLHGRIGDHAADAILDERYDGDGLAREILLLLRPYAAVKEAIRRMGELLGERRRGPAPVQPLPGAARPNTSREGASKPMSSRS
jgi:hypothetical protein